MKSPYVEIEIEIDIDIEIDIESMFKIEKTQNFMYNSR